MKHWLTNMHTLKWDSEKSGTIRELNPGPLDVRSKTIRTGHPNSSSILLLLKAFVACGRGCSCRRWTACAIRCQNIYTVQIKIWICYSQLMASLNCSKVGSSMMSWGSSSQSFMVREKKLYLKLFVGVRWCTESGKSERMLTSSCTAFVSDVIWKRDGYTCMMVKDFIHHGEAWLQSPFLECRKSDVQSHCCDTVFPAVIPCDKSYPLLWMFSRLSIWFCRYGSHIAAPYSSCDLTRVM